VPAADAVSTPAPSAFVVQLGVFASPVNAEALRDRLKLAGIAAHTETRLQVGPFTDRMEAERMLNRLRRLGVQAVLVPQVKDPFSGRPAPAEAIAKPQARK
jgi:cell division septation protein DedD